MKKLSRVVVLLIVTCLFIAAASCATETPQEQPTAAPPADSGATDNEIQSPEPLDAEILVAPVPTVDRDREGNPITLPDNIETIISLGPSFTEIIVELGLGDKLIATDEYSGNVNGLKPGISYLDMLFPDGEQIINLQPDVMFVTGMGKETTGDDPLKVVTDAGICVIFIPSSTNVEGIMEDIRFIAAVLGVESTGDEIIARMEKVISEIRAIGETITDRKNVYFEIEAAPWMYSFGTGVFLNEMIEITGAVNIFEDHISWVSVADEVILAIDPDVILTSVNYIDDPIGEIKSRPGWSGISAIKNDAVYYIDTDASNRPSHNVVKALVEIAKAVYPEVY